MIAGDQADNEDYTQEQPMLTDPTVEESQILLVKFTYTVSTQFFHLVVKPIFKKQGYITCLAYFGRSVGRPVCWSVDLTVSDH